MPFARIRPATYNLPPQQSCPAIIQVLCIITTVSAAPVCMHAGTSPASLAVSGKSSFHGGAWTLNVTNEFTSNLCPPASPVRRVTKRLALLRCIHLTRLPPLTGLYALAAATGTMASLTPPRLIEHFAVPCSYSRTEGGGAMQQATSVICQPFRHTTRKKTTQRTLYGVVNKALTHN